MQGPFVRQYGVATTIVFELFEVDGVDFRVDAAHASGDTTIMKDEAAPANTTNGFVDEGTHYSLALTATEMEASRIVISVVDQTATKVWLDTTIVIETFGAPSAQFPATGDTLVSADIDSLASQTSFTLTEGSADDDAYNGMIAVITDATTGTQKAVGLISDYTGSTKTVTLAADPGIFTMASGDLIEIIVAPPQLPNALAAANGGLPTVDANNHVAGIQGTKNQLDDLNDLTAAAVNAEVDTALADYDGPTHTELISEIDAVQADIAALNDPTAAAIADAVLDELLSGHTGAGSLGQAISDILTDTGTTLDDKLDTIDTVVDAIKAKTDSLTFTVAGKADSNITHVNETEVAGTGAEGDEWGPI